MRRGIATAILAACVQALIACGTQAASAGPTGRIIVSVGSAVGTNSLFEPVHWAKAIDSDGTVVVSWKSAGGVPVEVPSGAYRVEAFTVFLSDTLVCGHPIGEPSPPNATCFQPTLGPAQVCAVEIQVPPGGDVALLYRETGEGRCDLRLDGARPT